MNYCSIDDAWKNSDYISDQLRQYENPYEKAHENNNEKNIIENFNCPKKNQINNLNMQYDLISNLNNQQMNNLNNQKNTNQMNNLNNPQVCVFSCDDFMEHLNTCKTCRIKMRNRFSSKMIERLQNVVLDNKDTILLILMALFVLIFFNLLISIFRK